MKWAIMRQSLSYRHVFYYEMTDEFAWNLLEIYYNVGTHDVVVQVH